MCRALLGHLWFFAFFAHIHFAGGDHYLCQHRTVTVCLLYLYLNTVHYQSRLPTLKIIYCPETPKVPGSLIMWAYVHWFVSVTESTPSSSQQIFNIKLSNVVLFFYVITAKLKFRAYSHRNWSPSKHSEIVKQFSKLLPVVLSSWGNNENCTISHFYKHNIYIFLNS